MRIGPPTAMPYWLVAVLASLPARSSSGVGSRHRFDVRSKNTEPCMSLVPDFVTAVIAALLIWSYSAL